MRKNPSQSSGGVTKRGSRREGYLHKKGPLGVWQKRWFVFEKGELRYYRDIDHYREDAGTGGGSGGIFSSCCGRVQQTRNIRFTGNRPQDISDVEDQKKTDAEYGDEDSAIDFKVGGMRLRASSVEEKKAWLAVLSNASMVRSMSSRNLAEQIQEAKDLDLGVLRIEDLHMGEVVGSGTTGTVKLAVHIPTGYK
eukprot:SAG31_NODE_9760_length_1231_cov_1.530919_1_plen_193_part_10